MEDAILSLEKQAMERWRNGDPWGFVELSAGDISYVDPGLAQPINGLEQYQAYMKQVQGKIHYQGSEFIEPRVIVLGDAAVLSYNYRSSELSPQGTLLSQTPWNATEVLPAGRPVENRAYALVLAPPQAAGEPGSAPAGAAIPAGIPGHFGRDHGARISRDGTLAQGRSVRLHRTLHPGGDLL